MRRDDLSEIIALASRLSTPKATRLRVVIDQSARKVRNASSPRPFRLEEIYEETADGHKFYDSKIFSDEKLFVHKTAFSDGVKCANITYDRKTLAVPTDIGINKTFMDDGHWGFPSKPDPVRLYSVGMTPLPKALATAERMGATEVMGRGCEVFRFAGAGRAGRGQTLIYSLDRATGLPLRVVSYAKSAQVDADKPSWIWEATAIKEVSGRHIAAESIYRGFVVKETEPGEWTSDLDVTQTIRVAEVAFDEALPPSHFWPVFPPGVMVLDQFSGTAYRVPSADQRMTTTIQSTAPGAPIRVDSRSDHRPLIWTGVGLSLAVLAVAGVLWKRSRWTTPAAF